MRTYVKRWTAAMLVLFAIAFTAEAKGDQHVSRATVQNSGLTMLEKDLQRGDSPEIVEGSLYDVVECKNLYPDLDYSQLLETIIRISKETDNPAIAYKAYLVSMYLLHSSEIHVKPVPGAETHDYLFKQIADQLETKLLS